MIIVKALYQLGAVLLLKLTGEEAIPYEELERKQKATAKTGKDKREGSKIH